MKRRASALRKTRLDDAGYSDDAYSDPPGSDEDFVPKAKGRKKNTIAAAGPAKKRKLSAPCKVSDAVIWSHPRSTHIISTTQRPAIRAALLAWFGDVRDKRGMPWRKRYDPSLSVEDKSQRAYEVWVSEVMLQQTQVATVIPYYNRWLNRFPTLRDLASASIDEVNAIWKGLGYYSRASRLLQGARKVVDEMGGRLPSNAKAMEAEIPGIGRYSAGAICSIAYAEPVPVLDGNVNRLLSRFLALHAPPKSKSTLDVLWAAATAMVDFNGKPQMSEVAKPAPEDADVNDLAEIDGPSENVRDPNPGDINQALIELGSTVCKVSDPQCSICPLRTWCSAYAQSSTSAVLTSGSSSSVGDIEDLCTLCEPLPDGWTPASLPMKAEKKKAREETDLVHVIEWESSSSKERWFLLSRRPETGLLAGLHEFPTLADIDASLSAQKHLEKHARDTVSSFVKLDPSPVSTTSQSTTVTSISKVKVMGNVTHVFSHIKKEYRVLWVVLRSDESTPPDVLTGTVPAMRPPSAVSKARKKKQTGTRSEEPSGSRIDAAWVPFDEVPNANIGTGMGKVWNLVCTAWGEN